MVGLEIAQPGLDGARVPAEMRIVADRDQRCIVAAVVTSHRRVDAVLRKQLRAALEGSRLGSQACVLDRRRSRPGREVHSPFRPSRRSASASLAPPISARYACARDTLAGLADRIDETTADAVAREKIAHERSRRRRACDRSERSSPTTTPRTPRRSTKISRNASGESVAMRSSKLTKKHSSKPAAAKSSSRSCGVHDQRRFGSRPQDARPDGLRTSRSPIASRAFAGAGFGEQSRGGRDESHRRSRSRALTAERRRA